MEVENKMNEAEHLLSIAGEECCEISQVCSKISRFGIDDVYTHIDAETGAHTPHPEKGTNRQRLIDELNDLAAVIRMLTEHGIIPQNWADRDKQFQKMQKVRRYMKYSRDKGLLQ
jgi:hypothetical protein